jgi:hypothetical protein
MHVHLIYNPNRPGAEVRVHEAGCRDISRDIRFGPRGCTSHYSTEVASKQEAAEDFYADFIEEESMTAERAREYTEFLPCTDGLPETGTTVTVYHNLSGDGFFGYSPQHQLVKVFEYEAELPDGIDWALPNPHVTRVLEQAFETFNVGETRLAQEYRARRLRSLSVGDVIVLGGLVAFCCARAGWEQLPPADIEALPVVEGADAERIIRDRFGLRPAEPMRISVPL